MSWTEIILLAFLAVAVIANYYGRMSAKRWQSRFYRADARADRLLVENERIHNARFYDVLRQRWVTPADDRILDDDILM